MNSKGLPSFKLIARPQWLAGLATCGLLLNLAGADPASGQVIDFTDIRGVVTVNGQPTPGVKIEVLCCDNGQVIDCPSAVTYSSGLTTDWENFVCSPYLQTNYDLAFNNNPNGSYPQCWTGCSAIPGLWFFGNYTPWAVSLCFSYQGCTQYVSCSAVSNAYNAALTCWPPVINVNLTCTPPCPPCVDPQLGLGSANGCTVLELGAHQVSVTGPAGGILGEVCIAPNGKLSMSGDEYVAGTIQLGPGVQFQNSSHSAVSVQKNVDLSPEINDAYAAYANAVSLFPTPTQIFTTLDGKSVTTITGNVGINVINVQNINLAGKQITITGPVGAEFIFNVTGKFVLTGGGAGPQIRVAGGVQPKDVLYNIIGTGADVAFSGGGGGVGCCAAVVDGTILAPYRKIALSPGLVNGEIISGLDISIVSGSSVRCPSCNSGQTD